MYFAFSIFYTEGRKQKEGTLMKKLNLAIIGQGRSGKDIHGLFYRSEDNRFFNVKYVVDADAYRRQVSQEIYPGCATFADYKDLYQFSDIDLVVNATFSEMHYPITKDLLSHGLNVMVEKPLAGTYYECQDLIKTAKEKGVLLAPFMQSFYAPYYQKARQVIASGVLGDIKQIDITYSGFSRRWDWQTLQKKLAGNIYNTGPHPIGLALGFLDFDPRTKVVFSRLDKTMTSGDADDYAKILLAAPGKPLIDLEINSNDAYPVRNVKILGSKGTLHSTLSRMDMTYIVDGENVERPVVEDFLKNENGDPIYCWEELCKHEESQDFVARDVFTKSVAWLYENVYNAITRGDAWKVTPEMAAQVISVIECVHAENPMPVLY